MAQTVYVPLDGSERAESALPPAVALASRTDAELVLVRACRPDGAADTAESYLSARAAFLDHPARTWLVLDRDPAEAIRVAAEEPDSLVCMSTRGLGAIREAVLGSVSEEVVRNTRAPVLLVGPDLRSDWALGDQPVVLAGVDGSLASLAAVRAAGDLAATIDARVRAVEVLRPSDVITIGEYPGGDVAMLEAAVAGLVERGVKADYDLVDGYDAADTLSAKALAEHVAVVAVASHGRTGVTRVLLGSVAMRTVRHAPCPVLVVGPAVPAPS